MLRAVFATLALVLAGYSAQALAPRSPLATPNARVFSGWTSACDNTAICAAQIVLAPVGTLGGERERVVLRIISHPAPNHQPMVRLFDLADPQSPARRQSNPPVLTLFQDGLGGALSTGLGFASGAPGEYALGEDEAARLLDHLRRGGRFHLAMGDGSTADDQVHELKAGTAFHDLLAWWDDQRSTSGTPYAMAPTVYDGPDMPAPVFEPVEVVRRKAFAASTEKVPPKGVLAAASPSYGEVLAQWRGYRLGPDLILWQRDSIRTGFAVRTVFYLYHKGRAQPLRLPGAPSGSIGEVLVEPQRGTIRAASKAGSHGDCGMILSWGWTGPKAGFRQIEQLEMPLCQGLPERFWLRTYRTDHVIG